MVFILKNLYIMSFLCLKIEKTVTFIFINCVIFYMYFVTLFLSIHELKLFEYPLHSTYILFSLVFNIFSITYSPELSFVFCNSFS